MKKKKSRKSSLKKREGGVPSRLADLTKRLIHLLRCLHEHHYLKPKPGAPGEEDQSIDLNFLYNELDQENEKKKWKVNMIIFDFY